MSPTAGAIVMYHHPEDGVQWPALILEVVATYPDVASTDDVVGALVHGEADPPGTVYECLLQVFRPRGNFWTRCGEGEKPGQWSLFWTAPEYHHIDTGKPGTGVKHV
jgi:hypothetical protein